MIVIDKVAVIGFDTAIRGTRNSWDSREKSDSRYDDTGFHMGSADLDLLSKLVQAGDSHAKAMRLINVTCDIRAPRYWWTEFDTYKVGTVRCSCSTMHTITKEEFTVNDFSGFFYGDIAEDVKTLNALRQGYLAEQDGERKREFWRRLICKLPQSYNQTSTVMMNYQVLRHIYKQRKSHKLREWHTFCNFIETLPYSRELITR